MRFSHHRDKRRQKGDCSNWCPQLNFVVVTIQRAKYRYPTMLDLAVFGVHAGLYRIVLNVHLSPAQHAIRDMYKALRTLRSLHQISQPLKLYRGFTNMPAILKKPLKLALVQLASGKFHESDLQVGPSLTFTPHPRCGQSSKPITRPRQGA
jgi:hypothetical protein